MNDQKRFDINRHPLLKRHYDACLLVDALPSGVDNTRASVAVCDLRDPLVDLLDQLDLAVRTLKRIAAYETPDAIREQAEGSDEGCNEWGLDDPAETIEMAYENTIGEAEGALSRLQQMQAANP